MNTPKSELSRTAARAALLVALASTFSLSACGRVPGQFEIVNNQVPRAPCVIAVDETVYQGQGLLDVSLVKPGSEAAFFVFPLLKNNLPGATDGVDTNKIVLESFAIDLSAVSGPAEATALFGSADSSLRHYKTPWSGSIPSAGGRVGAWVAAIPVQLANILAASPAVTVTPSLLLNVRIRAFGHTTVSDIESDPFDYPVSVCSGCLVANVQPCPYTSPPTNRGNACNVAQDIPVDCCLSGNDLLCPPPVSL